MQSYLCWFSSLRRTRWSCILWSMLSFSWMIGCYSCRLNLTGYLFLMYLGLRHEKSAQGSRSCIFPICCAVRIHWTCMGSDAYSVFYRDQVGHFLRVCDGDSCFLCFSLHFFQKAISRWGNDRSSWLYVLVHNFECIYIRNSSICKCLGRGKSLHSLTGTPPTGEPRRYLTIFEETTIR